MNFALPILRSALALALLAPFAAAAPKPEKPLAPALAADTAAADTSARAAVAAPAPGEDEQLRRALARMTGVVPGSDSLVDWALFRAHPQRTVELILPALAPVKRDLWLGAPNMVWRIRVLQRLTGMEFRGPTRRTLTAEEAAVLLPDTLNAVRFAGENRDLGMTWTAPEDAQKAIVARWRQWWQMDAKKPEMPLVRHADDRSWWY